MIEFRNVSQTLGGRPVLRYFNLTVQAGERLVVYGPSGSGKTTVLRLIAGFLAPDEGSILLDGTVASADGRIVVPPEERGIGFVFQDLALWPHMSVFENVEFPLKVMKVSAPQRKQEVDEGLAMVGLEGFALSYPTNLSGGQQQRVALARALIARPKTILMDEPLANLDEELQVELIEQILRLHASLGFTLVYITHGKEERRRLATRSVLLRGGSAIAAGPS